MVRDFILFDYTSKASKARNVDARTAGFELGGSYKLAPAWTAQATVAYSWGSNRSDGTALPQMPPLEARLGLDYAQGPWTAGALWRLVAAQHRYTKDQGNVVGRDMGASSGFGAPVAARQLPRATAAENHRRRGQPAGQNLCRAPEPGGQRRFRLPRQHPAERAGRTLWLRADMQF